MQIYLAKPGGQKKGPYTLEQINEDLATSKYRDDEYWAWHEGLPKWMPLHTVPGVSPRRELAAAPSVPVPVVSNSEKPATPFQPFQAKTKTVSTPEPVAEEVEVAEEAVVEAVEPEPVVEAEVPAPVYETGEPAAESTESTGTDNYSGRPFPALEQIFIFTSGEGRMVFESETVRQKLEETVGEPVDLIRENIQVDVIGRANVGAELMQEGSIPAKAWRAMTAIKPDIAQKAKDELYEICVRPFSAETQDSVALFLLYNKEKFECAAV